MDDYETVRGMPQKGGFGEIFIVRKKNGGSKGPTFVLKRARLAKMSEQEKWRLHNEVSSLETAARGRISAPQHLLYSFRESTSGWEEKVAGMSRRAGFDRVFRLCVWVALQVEVHRSIQRGLPEQHENIVAFKESFMDRKVFGCIVLEHCKGGDLLSRVNIASKKNQIIPEEQCLDWFSQIASAVECMHAEGILHRDLKLANCFLTGGDDPIVKVGDFGLACQLPEGCECAEEKCGTITAMAPELILHGYGTYKSDVWALGTILYELTTHGPVFQVPFDSFGLDIRRYKSAMSRPIKPIPEHYSRSLRGMTDAILTVEVDDRPMASGVMKMLHEWPSNAPEPRERKQSRIDRVGSMVDCGKPAKQRPNRAAAANWPAPTPAPAPPASSKQSVAARHAGGGAHTSNNDPGGVVRKAKALAAAEIPPTVGTLARRSATRKRRGNVVDRLTAKHGAAVDDVENETPRFGRRATAAASARGRPGRIKSAGPVRSPSKTATGGAAPATPPAAKPGRRPNSATVKGSPPAVPIQQAVDGVANHGDARSAAASLVAQAATAQEKAAALEAARQRAQLAVKKISAKAGSGETAVPLALS